MKCALPTSPEYQYVQRKYGKDIAAVALERNNAYALHLAPNGKPSRFYQDLVARTGSPVRAEIFKILSYSKTFSNTYGDWVNGEYQMELDSNGEPYAEDVVGFLSDLQAQSLAPVGNSREKMTKLMDRLTSRLGLTWEWAPELHGIGIVRGKTIRLNPRYVRLDTPFHEVTHRLMDAIKVQNPKLWERLKKNVPESEIAFVKHVYTELKSDDAIMDEAVVTHAAKLMAYEYAGNTLDRTEANWLMDLLKAVADFFRQIFGRPIEPRSLSNKPFLEVYDMLMGNEEIRLLPLSEENQLDDMLLDSKLIDANGKWLGSTEELNELRRFIKERNLNVGIIRQGVDDIYIDVLGQWSLQFDPEIAKNQNNDKYSKSKQEPDQYQSSTNNKVLHSVGRMLRLFHPQEDKRNLSDSEYKQRNAEQIVERIWKGQDKNSPMVIDQTGRSMSYDEAVAHFVRTANETTASGRLYHKIIELSIFKLAGETKHAAAIVKARQEALQMAMEAGVNFNKVYNNITAPFTNEDKSFNPKLFMKHLGFVGTDDFLSEQVIANVELGTAGTSDLIVKHKDGSVSILDIKSTMMHDKESGLPLRFSDKLMLNNADMNDLQVMLYAIMYKANNPDAQIRSLAVLYNDGQGSLRRSAVSITKTLPAIKEMLISEGHKDFVDAHADLFRPETYQVSMLDISSEFEGMDAEQAAKLIRAKISKLVDPKKKHKGNIDDLAAHSDNPEVIRLAEQLLAIKAGRDRARQVSFDSKENKDMSALFRLFGHINRASSNILATLAEIFNRAFHDYNGEMFTLMNTHDNLLKTVIQEIDGGFIAKIGARIATNPAKYTGWMWKTEGNVMRFIRESDPEFEKQVNTDAKRAYYTFYKESFLKYSNHILKDPLASAKISKSMNAYYSAVKRNELYTVYLDPTDQEAVFNTDILKQATDKGEYKNLWNKFLDRFTQSDVKSDVEYRVPLKGLVPDSRVHTMDTEIIFKQHMANLLWKKHMDPTIEMFNMARSALPRDAGGNFVSPKNAKFLADFTEVQLLKNKRNMAGTFTMYIKHVDKDGQVIRVKRLVAVPELIMDFLRRWTNYAIMPLRPVLFLRNLLMEQTFNTINAAAGSYASIAGGKDEDMFTMGDLAKAHQILASAVFDKEVGRKIKNIEQKYKFGVDFTYEFDNSTRLLNKSWLRERTLFATSRIGEDYSAKTAWIAAMVNDGMWDKYDADGNYTGEARFKIRGIRGLEEVKEYTFHETNRIREIISRIHGTYSKERASYVEAYAAGRLILQFKKYLINFGMKIFSGAYNSEAMGRYVKSPMDYNGEEVFEWEGQIEEGAVQTIFRLAALTSSHGLNIFFNPKLQKAVGLTQLQMHNLAEVTVNMVTIMLSMIATNVVFDPDDDDNNQKNLLYRELNKLIGDLAGIYNIREWGRSAQTPSIALKRLVDIIDALFMLGDTYKTSSDIYGYKKGQNKGLKRLGDIALPFSSGWKEALTVWAIAVNPDDVAKRFRPSEIAFSWERDQREAKDR